MLPIIPLRNHNIKDIKDNKSQFKNLPPISLNYNSNNISNINNIISEVKNNLSRLEGQNIKRDKSKIKSELGNKENKEGNTKESKISQVRNYSQGVRNINLQNNLNQNNNFNINNYSQIEKIISKNSSAKVKSKVKKLSNNKKNNNKDSNSEKSINYSGNISEEDNTEIDLDPNNISDEDILRGNAKKRNNHFRDNRKSNLMPYYNTKDESPGIASPLKKDHFIINKNRNKDDSTSKVYAWNDFQPQFKKKELNVFLNEKQGKKIGKKTPFKI